MKEEDTPGLAMSRSLGDGLAHKLGVSAEPGKHNLVVLFQILFFYILTFVFRGEIIDVGAS
jgi:hypothetical protein